MRLIALSPLPGPFLLTNLMLPVLEKSAPSRVIIVSSGGALTQRMDLSDPQFRRGKWYGTRAYAQTKVPSQCARTICNL